MAATAETRAAREWEEAARQVRMDRYQAEDDATAAKLAELSRYVEELKAQRSLDADRTESSD